MQKNEKMEKVRHSLAHLMSMAIMEKKFPQAGLGVGPAIEDGFYQDYDLPESISEKDFEWIEKRMREMIAQKIKFIQSEDTFENALKFYQHDPYKTEMIEGLREKGEKKLSFYDSDWFHNLCAGPHVADTGEINPDAFKLTKVAGAYWRGDEKNKMLLRIYGVAFETKAELDAYLNMLAEAEKRDHKKLGKELDLFCFSELVGAGLPMFTPRGTIIREEISKFLNKLKTARGYELVDIPHLAKVELYKTSGHYDKFKNDIFYVKGKSEEFVLKPMNCPHHAQIFTSRPRSYREMPFRYAEITKQYRDEQTGELSGLSRVRSISIDDTHIFLRPDQIGEEAKRAYEIIEEFYQPFGIKLDVRLSVRDPEHKEKYLGTDAIWAKAEAGLKEFLKGVGQKFAVDEGEAAFYGPKIDFKGFDSLGREWQLATIQLDFNLPDRFELEYTDEKGEKVRPVMIHIAVAGSLERFMSILIEHYAGAFPAWLAPVQVELIPVSPEKHGEGALKLKQELGDLGVRVEVDDANETLGNRVRKAIGQKIPYILAVGDKELGGEEWMIRIRGVEKQEKMSKEKFVERILGEIKERK